MAELSTEEAYHYEQKADLPKQLHKYWGQRYDIFSKYDEGILLTEKAWFSVTPEPIATQIAEHVAKSTPGNKTIIIDPFAGAGGNVIAFALSGRWERVFAIEKDAEILKCAKANAKIYGVEKKIWWIHGDSFKQISTRFKSMGNQAVIFASPPWGGPSYTEFEVFDLSVMQPYNLKFLYESFSKITKEIAIYLPRNSDLDQIASVAPKENLPVVHYCMRGASKALVVYYGAFSDPTG